MVTINCTACQQPLRLRNPVCGQLVRCRNCGAVTLLSQPRAENPNHVKLESTIVLPGDELIKYVGRPPKPTG